MRLNNSVKIITALLPAAGLGIILAGCSPAAKTGKTEREPQQAAAAEPPKPEIVLKIGSLNLQSYQKKIEPDDIRSLAETVRRENIDVVAVQSVTRYPGLNSRMDFV